MGIGTAAELPLGTEPQPTTAYPRSKGISNASSTRDEDSEVLEGWPQVELRLPREESGFSGGAEVCRAGGSWLQGVGGLHDTSEGEDEEGCPRGDGV